ncbi:MAG TPA: hypothetical protein DCE25_05950 [Pseudomonas sp.]|nr:hypothetical protein [Pseudomonas sp.]
MPTENRSSNTENAPCPFCGGQVDPEGWLRDDGVRGPECESCGATAPNLALWNGAHPAQQDKGDAVWYEHAMRDEKGRPFQFQVTRDKEPAFGKADVDYDHLYSVTVDPLYKHADPAELERLRKELLRWRGIAEILQVDAAKLSDDGVEFMTRAKHAEADLERLQRRIQNADLALKAQTQNCDTLRAQLAEAHGLLRLIAEQPMLNGVHRARIKTLLSVSAEPEVKS